MLNFDQFIKITEDSYIINLSYLSDAEQFNLHLLELLLSFATKRYNANNVCDIYILEFTNFMFTVEIPFIYPYVDKDFSFNSIFELYLCRFNSNSICLYINKKM
jgi:hypothetical protein